MHRLFGRKKEEKPTEPPPSLDDAIGRTDGRVAALEDKIKKLDAELMGYRNQLKRMPPAAQRGVKQRALQALRRKKMYEQQRDQMLATSFNMEQTAYAVTSAKDTLDTVAAMRGAATQLRAEHKKLDISSLEDLQDDLADLMADTDEINELMGRSYGMPDDVCEADLEEELAGLEDMWEAEEASGVEAGGVPAYLAPAAPEMPSVPSAVPAGGGGSGGEGLPVPASL